MGMASQPNDACNRRIDVKKRTQNILCAACADVYVHVDGLGRANHASLETDGCRFELCVDCIENDIAAEGADGAMCGGRDRCGLAAIDREVRRKRCCLCLKPR